MLTLQVSYEQSQSGSKHLGRQQRLAAKGSVITDCSLGQRVEQSCIVQQPEGEGRWWGFGGPLEG